MAVLTIQLYTTTMSTIEVQRQRRH